MADPTAKQKRLLAKMGYAMPDGSYYIRAGAVGIQDLENAIQAVGRSNNPHDDVRLHIMKRAKALGKSDMIPASWNTDGSLKQSDPVEDFLAHHGIKGMHWGVRKGRVPEDSSEDHARASEIKAKVKKHGGIHALSNDEIKTLNERLNLEQNYRRLTPEHVSTGKKVLNGLLDVSGNIAKQQATNFANQYAKQGAEHLIKKVAA